VRDIEISTKTGEKTMNKLVNTFVAVVALALCIPALAQDGMPTPPAPVSKAAKRTPEAPIKLKAGQGTVNVNRADRAELVRVPGIGNSLAERILACRKENGKFADWKSLTEVKGIGEKKLARLKPFLSL
jgi:competence ComEA-like helix-hairpin-helix protein